MAGPVPNSLYTLLMFLWPVVVTRGDPEPGGHGMAAANCGGGPAEQVLSLPRDLSEALKVELKSPFVSKSVLCRLSYTFRCGVGTGRQATFVKKALKTPGNVR